MPKNKESTIKLNFSQINALADQKLELFTNSFTYHDDDYFHKSIGSLFGIIQITDHSKNSEYIPNLLTSVIKKTFYSNVYKTTEENFEFALKKVNLALADLAEHNIVEWNNNLHAIVGVFNKHTLLFTQVGNASISIGRNKKIIKLSESNPPATTHPIKTFKDIAVGEIKLSDKLIITTPTIKNIFNSNDLSRLFKTFSSKEFDNIFFKTLKKEGENISAIIINVIIKEKLNYSKVQSLNNENLPLEKLTKNKNFLGNKIKKKKSEDKNKKIATTTHTPRIKKATSIVEPIQVPKDSTKKSTTNQKTTPASTPKKRQTIKKKKKEKRKKTTAHLTVAKNISPKKKTSPTTKSNSIKSTTKSRTSTNQTKTKTKKTRIKSISSSTNEPKIKPKLTSKKPARKLNDLKDAKKSTKSVDISPFEKTPEIYIKHDDLEKKAKKPSSKKLNKFFYTKKKKSTKTINTRPSTSKTSPSKLSKNSNRTQKQKESLLSRLSRFFTTSQKYLSTMFSSFSKSLKKYLLTISSSFSKSLKKYSSSLHNSIFTKKKSPPKTPSIKPKKDNFNLNKTISFIKQYRNILLLGLFIILIPIIIYNLTKSNKEEVIEKLKLPEKPIVTNNALVENKNQTRDILSLPAPIKLLTGNTKFLIAYTNNNQLYQINKETNQSEQINIPNEINLSDLKAINYMPSLNLFFLSSDSQTVSYSPKIKKFIINKIELPNNFTLTGQAVYLSYLYLLDNTSKQIYRYPRDTGGFGISKKWLKQPLQNNIAEISSMTIDENIRISYLDGTVEKYFGGKLKDTKKFELQSLEFIKTNNNLKYYYLLSKKDGKILQINKNTNEIEREYQHSAIQNTSTFTVDEKKNLIYLFNDKELLSIDL